MPDGKELASNNGSYNTAKIELWDVSKRKISQTLKGATSPFAFSPDGKTIATWSESNNIQLWQVKR